jgi:hypothetical protein
MASSSEPLLPALPGGLLDELRRQPDPHAQFVELADALIDQNPSVRQRLHATDGLGSGLTEPQRVFATLTRLDGEIMNGGLTQFFWNRPGWVEHVESALRAVGASELADAFVRALAQLAGNADSFIKQRKKDSIEAYLEADDDLDLEWFEDLYFGEFDRATGRWTGLVDGLYTATVAYVLAHLDSFAHHR